MSDMIKQAYDEMELDEVICRLPSKFAIDSIKRRIDSVDKLKELFEARDAGGANKSRDIKEHINVIISDSSVDDIFNSLTTKYHPTLFGWLNGDNKTRLLKDGKDKLTVEFIFNITEAKDFPGLKYLLGRVLSENDPQVPKVISILNKVDSEYFQLLIEPVLKDIRPEIKSSILSVYNGSNTRTISDHQKMIALKSFAKIPASQKGTRSIQPIDFKLFKDLKSLERIMALDRYLDYFPKHRKIKVFRPEPTKEEFDSILFAGCFQYNDVVEDIVKKYKEITEDEKTDASAS